MRLAVWSPLPPSRSGIADYALEQARSLERHLEPGFVVEDPGSVAPELAARHRIEPAAAVPEADLDLYHVGNSPDHAYVYRAARSRPGVVLLHDWCLHDLVRHETLARGDRTRYLREMRRAYGEAGSFVGRQVACGLGGELLPKLYPLNERVLDASLAVVGLSAQVCARVRARLPRDRPVLQLPHHLSLPLDPPPDRALARRQLGLAADALVVTAPGFATRAKSLDRVARVVARLRASHPRLQLIVAGAVDPGLELEAALRQAGLEGAARVTGRLSLEDFTRHLAAADVIVALRFPSHGEMSGALVRALGVGRPALVTAGTPAAEEFPEGLVAPIDPGPGQERQLEATLALLLGDAGLRETMGRLAGEHVRSHHALEATAARLAAFLEDVRRQAARLREQLRREAVPDASLADALMQEVRFAAHELGVGGVDLGLRPLLQPLVEGGR
jgi:glycosyltransferase involved in cell wall biosynthesis